MFPDESLSLCLLLSFMVFRARSSACVGAAECSFDLREERGNQTPTCKSFIRQSGRRSAIDDRMASAKSTD
jgi:hypothetical protein